MQITHVELVPLALPFARPYVTARGVLEKREMMLVVLHTDEGLEGLGEAVPLSLRGGPGLAEIDRAARRAARRLRRADLSDFSGPEPLRAAVETFVHAAAGRRLPEPLKAALEMALFDLAGKAAGQPLWSLLGAESAEPVECNATLVAGEPGEVAADAERWAERGFRTFKLKLGTGEDVAQVRAVREALGPEAKLRVDANGVWSTDEALGVLALLEPLGIELVEQPASGIKAMAALTAATAIPIAADELVTSVKEARAAQQAKACDLVTAKLAKVGGIGPTNGIAGELPIYLSSALDGPLGIAAAGHAAQAVPFRGPAEGLAHGLATELLFSQTAAAVGCAVQNGALQLPSGPGLGVELDAEAVSALRIG